MKFILSILFVLFASIANAATPVLNFSDLTSGPKTGNGDGSGSGAIVTIWGNNLGSSQGASKVYVGAVEAAYVYYWKDADGTLPGGPADLKTYHKMQEVCFSVPSGASDGANTIKVTVGGVDSNTLPFTVRSGSIYFIKSTGNDSTGNGSWSTPWLTLSAVMSGDGKIAAGACIYSVGVGSTSGIKVGGTAQVAGTSASPIFLSGYPNTSIAVSGYVDANGGDGSVVNNWYPSNRNNQYVSFSKMSVTCAGNCAGSGDNSCVGFSAIPYNRIVGVAITGPTVYGGYGGAISGSNGVPQGGAYLGVYIHDYGYQSTTSGLNNYSYTYSDDSDTWTSPSYNGIGDSCTNCTSTDRFQHLYYISNRLNATGVPYEIGWNHLADNPILHGIHIYDMSECGWVGTMKVHHNVIKNQRGGAIDISVPTATAFEIHDNLIIYDSDTKLQGIPVRATGAGTVKWYNNTIYGWHTASYFEDATDEFRNNIMYDTVGVTFVNAVGPPATKSDNLFYSTQSTAMPSWYSTGNGDINADPKFTNAAAYDFSLQSSSPAIDQGYDTTAIADKDMVGMARSAGSVDMGAFEYAASGELPSATGSVGAWKKSGGSGNVHWKPGGTGVYR